MRHYLRIEALDLDGNISRMRLHTADIVSGEALTSAANIINAAFSGISDATIRKVTSELSEGGLELGTYPATGLNERSAIFLSTDELGHIYTNIIPAIADDMIATSGELSGVALSTDAIELIRTILEAVPVMSAYASLVTSDDIEGARVS